MSEQYEWTGSDGETRRCICLPGVGVQCEQLRDRYFWHPASFPFSDIPQAIAALQRLWEDSQRRVVIPLTEYCHVVITPQEEWVESLNTSHKWQRDQGNAKAILAALHTTPPDVTP